MGIDWYSTGCISDNGIPTLQCVPVVFQNIITAALAFAGIVAVIFIIWSGIQLIRSQGDQKAVQGARNTLTFALVGLILIISSFLIIQFIGQITGVRCIEQFGFGQCSGQPTGSDMACNDGQAVNQPPGCVCEGTVNSAGVCSLN